MTKRHFIQKSNETPDGRRVAPAALRNTEPLIKTLRKRLPMEGRILEVASGTGQHAAAFAKAFPSLQWIPSDIDPDQRKSISAWRQASALDNMADPIALDVSQRWPLPPDSVQGVLTVNLLHLIPGAYVANLFEEARKALSNHGTVFIYGPFLRGTAYASQGDREFDASLRARDPDIGYKSVEVVSNWARMAGLDLMATDAMPANNLLLTFALQ